jgi:hypothetical protein
MSVRDIPIYMTGLFVSSSNHYQKIILNTSKTCVLYYMRTYLRFYYSLNLIIIVLPNIYTLSLNGKQETLEKPLETWNGTWCGFYWKIVYSNTRHWPWMTFWYIENRASWCTAYAPYFRTGWFLNKIQLI